MPGSIQAVYNQHVESRLRAAEDVEAFRYVTHSLVRELDFSDFAFAKIIGENDFEISVSTIPDDMVSAYREHEIYRYDIMLECLKRREGYVFQQKIFRHLFDAPYVNERVRKNKVLKSIMDRHGICDSLVISTHNHIGGRKEVTALSVYCKVESRTGFRSKVMKNLLQLKKLAECLYALGYKRHATMYRNNVS